MMKRTISFLTALFVLLSLFAFSSYAAKTQEALDAAAAAEKNVCRIGSGGDAPYYLTLAEAVSAAGSGAVITMIADDLGGSKITLGKAVTIEGNNHIYTSSDATVVSVSSSVDVTLRNFTVQSTSTANPSSKNAAFYVGNSSASVTLEGCTVTTGKSYGMIAAGTVNLIDTTVEASAAIPCVVMANTTLSLTGASRISAGDDSNAVNVGAGNANVLISLSGTSVVEAAGNGAGVALKSSAPANTQKLTVCGSACVKSAGGNAIDLASGGGAEAEISGSATVCAGNNAALMIAGGSAKISENVLLSANGTAVRNQGKLTVSGGTVQSNSGTGYALVSDAGADVTVTGGNFVGGLSLSGKALDISTRTGASIRTVAGSSGIRFESDIPAATVQVLDGMKDAEELISYTCHTVIFKYGEEVAEKVAASGTVESLSDVPAFDIPAVNGILTDGDGNVSLRAALTNLHPDNYVTDLGALSYISCDLGGGNTFRVYAVFREESNVRNAAGVATAALADLRDTAGGEYLYPVGGQYSRFTDAQRAVIAGFLGE